MQRLRRAEKTVERHHSNGLWFPQFVSVEYVHCLISYHNFLMSKVRASWSEKEGGSLCKPQHFNTSMNEYFIGRACGTRKYRSRGKCMHHFWEVSAASSAASDRMSVRRQPLKKDPPTFLEVCRYYTRCQKPRLFITNNHATLSDLRMQDACVLLCFKCFADDSKKEPCNLSLVVWERGTGTLAAWSANSQRTFRTQESSPPDARNATRTANSEHAIRCVPPFWLFALRTQIQNAACFLMSYMMSKVPFTRK